MCCVDDHTFLSFWNWRFAETRKLWNLPRLILTVNEQNQFQYRLETVLDLGYRRMMEPDQRAYRRSVNLHDSHRRPMRSCVWLTSQPELHLGEGLSRLTYPQHHWSFLFSDVCVSQWKFTVRTSVLNCSHHWISVSSWWPCRSMTFKT